MKRYLLLVALVTLVRLAGPTPAAEPFRFPEARYGDRAELKYIKGLPVLTVAGTPEEIGAAAGALAVKPAAKVLDYPRRLMEHFNVGLLYPKIVRDGKEMFNQFPENYQKELEAMTRAADVERDKVVVGNTLFDIKKMVFCSALLADGSRSATGGPLLGRNLDYPSLGWVHEYSLVTVCKPRGKYAFASVGFPGLIGCVSGMNEAGLCVAIHEAFAAKNGEGRFDAKGIPYALCYRILLEECATIDEAKKKLETLPRTTITNLAVADKNGIAVFEITPKSVVVRQGERGVCACTNHFCTDALKPERKVDICRSYDRLAWLDATRDQKTPITVANVFKRLDDVNLGDETLQTMIFEPATLKLHLAIGERPSTQGPLRTLDLKTLFGK
jgi:predicted choloylglycine hydrolase